jgi:hypothetical protein
MESPYSSIFGRWWPCCASSTASSCRPKGLHLVHLGRVAVLQCATQTKLPGSAMYSLMLADRDVGQLGAFW